MNPLCKSLLYTAIDPKTDVSFQVRNPLLYIFTLTTRKLACFAKNTYPWSDYAINSRYKMSAISHMQ